MLEEASHIHFIYSNLPSLVTQFLNSGLFYNRAKETRILTLVFGNLTELDLFMYTGLVLFIQIC